MEELVRFTSKKLLNEHNSVSQCLVSCTMWATRLVLPLGTIGLILPCLHCGGDSAYEALWSKRSRRVFYFHLSHLRPLSWTKANMQSHSDMSRIPDQCHPTHP